MDDMYNMDGGVDMLNDMDGGPAGGDIEDKLRAE